jgi:hypothetical protein
MNAPIYPRSLGVLRVIRVIPPVDTLILWSATVPSAQARQGPEHPERLAWHICSLGDIALAKP